MDDGNLVVFALADELTLQCHPAVACFGPVHGLRGSLACLFRVSAGLVDIKVPFWSVSPAGGVSSVLRPSRSLPHSAFIYSVLVGVNLVLVQLSDCLVSFTGCGSWLNRVEQTRISLAINTLSPLHSAQNKSPHHGPFQ